MKGFDKIHKLYPVHKLVASAFLNHISRGNTEVVDHINNIKTDNRLENLQLISHRDNLSKDIGKSTSKYTGVSWYKNTGKWRAGIMLKGESIHLGYFSSELDAYKAYKKVKKQHGI